MVGMNMVWPPWKTVPSSQKTKNGTASLVWGHRLIILVLGRLRWENHEFKASLGYMVRRVSKTKKYTTTTKQSYQLLGGHPLN
jgi:hypothetical protein